MPRLGVAAAPVLAMGLAMAARASAQSTASAQAGFGTVRFAGGATTSLFSFSPDFSVAGPNHQASLGATLASVPHTTGYAQLHLATWLITAPVVGLWHLASDIEVSGATLGKPDSASQAGGRVSGAGSITGEALYVTPRWGAAIGAGPISGWITDFRPVTALHTRLRGWWSDALTGTTLTGSIEPTRFLGAWFTDVSFSAMRRRGRFSAQMTAAGRISSTYVSRAAALASLELRLTPSWSINVVGGNVLPDPYQGFPATGILLAGVKFQLPLHRSVARQVVGAHGFSVTRSAAGVSLEFERHGVKSVSIAGDWNGWVPTPLSTTRPDHWKADLALPPGVYHFTLLVDGIAWTIPSGVPSVPDGLGGRVAVLVVNP
jgi:AMP-activated protein kinase-like protein